MTIRISVTESAQVRHIRLDGRLDHEAVGELEQVIVGAPSAVCLELENLSSADAAGLTVLRRLWKAGVEMRGVRPHLAWRIELDES